MDIPKIFWRYYDLFRRKQITLEVFSAKTGLTHETIMGYLRDISQ